MGSYITAGIVFSESNSRFIKNKLEDLMDYLSDGTNILQIMKASKDSDGEEWIELKSANISEIQEGYNLLSEYYFGQIKIKSGIFKYKKIDVTVRVQKEDNYFGFLLDLVEADLIESSNREDLELASERIIKVISELHMLLHFDYAFCDNEAELQYSPDEFKKLKEHVYSVAAVPYNDNVGVFLNILKSNWHIDGLTARF